MTRKTNLVLDQGTDFIANVALSANLTGYSATSQMRPHYSSSTYYAFTANVAANGVVSISMTANTSNSVPVGRYMYDCILVDGNGKKSKAFEGIITVNPKITR